jgi:hypothetical protein
MYSSSKRALKRHPPPVAGDSQDLPPPPTTKCARHSSGARRRLRQQLQRLEQLQQRETIVQLTPQATHLEGWFAADVTAANHAIQQARLPGLVHDVKALHVYDCPPQTAMFFYDGPQWVMTVLRDAIQLADVEQAAIRNSPAHVPRVKRSGTGIDTVDGAHAYMGWMGMVGYRDTQGHCGPYFQLPCTPECVAQPTFHRGYCQWAQHAHTVIRRVCAQRHRLAPISDYRTQPTLIVPPAHCLQPGIPACALSVDFWARSHKDADHENAVGSFCTFTTGEVDQCFVLTKYHAAIRMVHGQIVVFDHQSPHCASRPSLLTPGSHTYGVVPIVKAIHGRPLTSTAPNRHKHKALPSLVRPMLSSNTQQGRTQMCQCYN